MNADRWIMAARSQGWQQSLSGAGEVRLTCCKHGCPGAITRRLSDLGPIPDPCPKPHEGQYSRKVFDDYAALVGELTRRRKALGLSQEDVAASAGLADGHISKLEAFHRIAQPPSLLLWAQTVGLRLTFEPAPLPVVTQKAIERRPAPLRKATRQKAAP